VSLGKKMPGRARLHPESASVFLFVLGSFCAYALAYGWYTPIGRGDRFMLSLYAPLVLSLLWASEAMLKRARRRKAPKALFIAYHTAQWLLFAALSWRLIQIWQYPLFRN
jgi:predicted Co/Zn/Cd cation transporter (cation efflux family)